MQTGEIYRDIFTKNYFFCSDIQSTIERFLFESCHDFLFLYSRSLRDLVRYSAFVTVSPTSGSYDREILDIVFVC